MAPTSSAYSTARRNALWGCFSNTHLLKVKDEEKVNPYQTWGDTERLRVLLAACLFKAVGVPREVYVVC